MAHIKATDAANKRNVAHKDIRCRTNENANMAKSCTKKTPISDNTQIHFINSFIEYIS